MMPPPFLDLRPPKVIVFGGGEVGLRQAKYFAEEAEVVVSRTFVTGFKGSGVEMVKEDAAANGWVDERRVVLEHITPRMW